MVGPTIQESVLSVFKLHKVSLSADSEEMHRRIRLREQDRVFHRFFYRMIGGDPEECWMASVTAAHHRQRCLNQLAFDSHESHPLASIVQ